MKWLVLLCAVLTVSFAQAQSITVKSDEQSDTDFSKFKTYYFASQVDNELDSGFYFLNDLVLKAQIRDAVSAELEGLGYHKSQVSPDLVVNFRVFDQPARLKSYEDYGSNFWSDVNLGNTSQDTTSYAIEAGTLLITLVDRAAGNLVWQGFASGLIDGNAFIKDEGKIKEAVNLIFNEYNRRAKEYTKK